ncbi:MAG: hypothetical protein ACXWQO_09230 [Bdellovibrionota bacterium]
MLAITKPESSSQMETATRREPIRSEASEEAVFIPTIGSEEELAHAAYLASLADPSRLGKSLAKAAIGKIGPVRLPSHLELVSASPISDLSGVNLKNSSFREGTLESIEKWVRKAGGHVHCQIHNLVRQIVGRGDKAIVIASEKVVLGVVILKVVKSI